MIEDRIWTTMNNMGMTKPWAKHILFVIKIEHDQQSSIGERISEFLHVTYEMKSVTISSKEF